MIGKNKKSYAGDDPADWTDEQLERVAGLTPGKLEGFGFARWPKDPAELVGLAPSALTGLQREVAAELERRGRSG